jgi:hypothetical protein
MTQIHDETFDDYLAQCVMINEHDINAEFVRVSADMAYWVRKAAQTERAFLLAKHKVKDCEATAYLQARELLDNDPAIKRPTEALVEATASKMPAPAKAREELAELAAQREELKGYLEAIKTKRDSLISLGAMLRREMQLDPAIRS